MSTSSMHQTAQNTPDEGNPFALISLDTIMTMPNPRWLVECVIPEYSLSVVYGQPKNGKSFFVLDLALCIAAGVSWNNHSVQQGHVVYIAGEGVRGLKRRIGAWMKVNEHSEGVSTHFFTPFPWQQTSSMNNKSRRLSRVLPHFLNRQSSLLLIPLQEVWWEAMKTERRI